MQQKSKSKAHDNFWAYRWSRRLHLLKRGQIEVTATPEECVAHLKKMPAPSVSQFLKVGIINNYKGHDVVIRVLTRPQKSRYGTPSGSGFEDVFILCHLEGKGNKTIVSLEVSFGKARFGDIVVGLSMFPWVLVFIVMSVFTSYKLALGWAILALVPALYGLLRYSSAIDARNKWLKYIVGYMFQLEEKLDSQHSIEIVSTPQSIHLAADSESHADQDQAR